METLTLKQRYEKCRQLFVCESRNSERALRPLNTRELTSELVEALENNDVWGVHYDRKKLVWEDCSGCIHDL